MGEHTEVLDLWDKWVDSLLMFSIYVFLSLRLAPYKCKAFLNKVHSGIMITGMIIQMQWHKVDFLFAGELFICVFLEGKEGVCVIVTR